MPAPSGVDLQEQVTNSYVAVSLIDPNPRNYKIHPPAKIARIANSLEKFGQPRSVTVQAVPGSPRYVMAAGHSVLAAATQLGWEKLRCDIIPADWDQPTVLAFLLAENELRYGSPVEDAALASILEELSHFDATLPVTVGFSDEELAEILDGGSYAELRRGGDGDGGGGDVPSFALPEDPGPQTDRAEELRQLWNVQPGQLWLLDSGKGYPHRLICGDCTDGATVARLMGGEKARMVHSDPPYGIGQDIENDNLRGERRAEFYRQWLAVSLSHCIDNAYVYIWGYFDTLSDTWQDVVKPRGDCNFRNFIIWEKHNVQGRNSAEFRQFPENYEACLLLIFGQPFQNGPWSTSPNAEYYPEMFEPLRAYLDGEREKMGWDIPAVKRLVGHSDLLRDHWFNRSQWSMPTRKVYEALQAEAKGKAFLRQYDELRGQYDELRGQYDELRGHFNNTLGYTDLWRFQSMTGHPDHPTVKSVEVTSRCVESTSKPGELVLEPFSGSGTTIIACEQLGRQARACEISPAYVAVALQRWADLTGCTPELID